MIKLKVFYGVIIKWLIWTLSVNSLHEVYAVMVKILAGDAVFLFNSPPLNSTKIERNITQSNLGSTQFHCSLTESLGNIQSECRQGGHIHLINARKIFVLLGQKQSIKKSFSEEDIFVITELKSPDKGYFSLISLKGNHSTTRFSTR